MKKLNILYEDEYIVVCHKEAGMAVQTRSIRQIDMERMLLNEFAARGDKTEVFVVHRLDQPVEGVMVFAKTSSAAAQLNNQFKANNIVKEYFAVIEGSFNKDRVHLENYMIKDGKTNLSTVVKEGTVGSKKAVLDLTAVASYDDTQLVKITLKTGRHHQIRVQLSSSGHPIVGDLKYNPKYVNYRGFMQTALCSYRLAFVHPVTGKDMEFKVKPSAEAFLQYNNKLEEFVQK